MSGDSEGKVWFWDWKTCRVFKCVAAEDAHTATHARTLTADVRVGVAVCRSMKAHDKVVIDCQWHPHETSKVATASWDGTIKYWD
jgi:pre-mRNA-processing factor 17